jgi:hypothetical protein
MSALKLERKERVRAEEAVEIIDCGQASERTKGMAAGFYQEFGSSPFIWMFLPSW